MRVNQTPEATELVPETPEECELLKRLVETFRSDPNRIVPSVQLDPGGVFCIWKF
jgi:hypothetical protein